MKGNVILAVSAAVLGVVALTSCKGRYADGTPNGETVEVVVEPTVVADDTATVESDEVEQGQTESDGVGLESDGVRRSQTESD